MVIIVVVGSDVNCISQFEVFMAFIVAAKSIVVEAMVWVRKYFVAASVARG